MLIVNKEAPTLMPSQNEIPITEEVSRVTDGIFRIIDREWANIYFVKGSEGNALIDTGFGSRKARGLIDGFVTNSPSKKLSHIILTHAHPDHSGGVFNLIERYPDAQLVFFDREEEEKIDGNTRVIELGDRRLTIFPSAGHTDDSQYIFDSMTNALFTGDNILGDLTADVRHMADYMSGLHTLPNLGPEILCPGHYEPSYQAINDIFTVIDHRNEREMQVIEALLEPDVVEIEDIFDKVYGEDYEERIGMAQLQIESILEKLKDEGKVTEADGKWKLKSLPRHKEE